MKRLPLSAISNHMPQAVELYNLIADSLAVIIVTVQ